MIPGQGTQKPGMLTPLINAFPRTLAPLLETLDATCPGLQKIISTGPSEILTHTPNAQPAILFTSIAILRVLEQDFGLQTSKFSHLLGHSLGEFSALVAANVLSLNDALTLVRRRGEAMAQCAETTAGEVGMFAVMVEKASLPELMKRVDDFIHSEVLPDDQFLNIANINSSTQIVLSGHVRAVDACLGHLRRFQGNDPRAIRLNVAAPFHSQIMAPAVSVVRSLLEGMDIGSGTHAKVVSNATARPYQDIEEMKRLLAAQAVETVQWKDSIAFLENEAGVTRWFGLGPGKVGRNLIGREVRGGYQSVLGVDGMDVAEMEKAVRELDL